MRKAILGKIAPIVIVLVLALVVPLPAYAQHVELQPPSQKPSVGSVFTVPVIVHDIKGIMALKARISYSQNLKYLGIEYPHGWVKLSDNPIRVFTIDNKNALPSGSAVVKLKFKLIEDGNWSITLHDIFIKDIKNRLYRVKVARINYTIPKPVPPTPPILPPPPPIPKTPLELKANTLKVAPGGTFSVDVILNPYPIPIIPLPTPSPPIVIQPMMNNTTVKTEKVGIPPIPIPTKINSVLLNVSYYIKSKEYTFGGEVSVIGYKTYKVFNFINTLTFGKNYFKFLGVDRDGITVLKPTKLATIKFKVNKTAKPGSVIKFIPTTALINDKKVPVNSVIIKIVEEPWQRYDKNGNGRIDDLELIMAIQDWLNNKLSDLDLIQIIMIWLKS